MENVVKAGEINELIVRIKAGDNSAWEQLYSRAENYVHKCAWNRIKYISEPENPKELEEDLFMAGWQGFLSALNNFDDTKGVKFLTYATEYINGEMSKELRLQINSVGLTGVPKKDKESGGVSITRVSTDSDSEALNEEIARALMTSPGITIPEPEDKGDYSTERRVLQIIEVLKKLTDEEHSLSCIRLKELLKKYREAKYGNDTKIEVDNTFNKSMAEILLELNPEKYTGDNDADYRIKYEGYREDFLNQKVKMKKDNQVKVETAPVINGLSFIHDFDNDSLDKLIQLVCFSDMFSDEEKERLVSKLVSSASLYYKSPFWNGEKVKFNPKAVHGRFSRRHQGSRAEFAGNINIIQQAMNNLGQITFYFNGYTADHKMDPGDGYRHRLSPYRLVVYHDNYYCIGLKKGDKRIWHYRVDLMTKIEIVTDEEGKIVPIEITAFEGLPICNAFWDPEKYMAEHLNMAYDLPRDIRIKIKDNGYTMLHDWFGDHYEKVDEITATNDKGQEVQYDIVNVKTSPTLIVHWAMQYGEKVEILDEDIRKKIREEVEKMRKMYC